MSSLIVIPAKAGIQKHLWAALDSAFVGGEKRVGFRKMKFPDKLRKIPCSEGILPPLSANGIAADEPGRLSGHCGQCNPEAKFT